MSDADSSYALGVGKRESLELLICGGACRSENRDLPTLFARIQPRLHHTTLGRRSAKNDPLAVEFGKPKIEPSVIEGRIARLEQKAFLGGRRKRRNHVATSTRLDRPPNKTWRIPIPPSEHIIHKDHRRARRSRVSKRALDPPEPTPKAPQQRATIVMGKRINHVNHYKHIPHPALHCPQPAQSNPQADASEPDREAVRYLPRWMPDAPTLVRTATQVIAVPADRFEALLERLERTDEGKPAADELRERNALSDENKRVLVRTLRLWTEVLGVDDMGADLNDLRYELMRDLNIPPWDTD